MPTLYIQNKDLLAVNETRKIALEIAEAGLAAIKTDSVIKENVRLEGEKLFIHDQVIDVKDIEHLYVVGVGKCSLDAVTTLEHILGDRIKDGVVIDVREDTTQSLKRIRAFAGTHPLPSEANVANTRTLLDLLQRTTEKDIVIAVISGGGSTLLCQPKTHTAKDEAQLFAHLTKKGATIQELNTVRKHLSLARGGNLAAACKAELFALIFSDVPGDDMSSIASGPTVFDATSIGDARVLLEKYQAQDIGFSNDNLFETPKDQALFAHTKNMLVLTNKTALSAMAEKAHELGFEAEIVNTQFKGDAEQVAHEIAKKLHEATAGHVLLYGGETTVTIRGNGKGGRNQHIALATLADVQEGEVLLSLASDGHDNTDHAGAIADMVARAHAQEKRLDINAFLQNSDSYTFFKQLESDVIITGLTGSNVSDIIIALKA